MRMGQLSVEICALAVPPGEPRFSHLYRIRDQLIRSLKTPPAFSKQNHW